MQRSLCKRVAICGIGILCAAGPASACPLCWFGMAQAHIANFESVVMGYLPIWASAITGLILYGKNIWRKFRS